MFLVVRKLSVALVCAALWAVTQPVAIAQSAAIAPQQNVVQLSAAGSVEVDQDVLILVLSITEEGSTAAAVQKRLQQAVDAALAMVRSQAKPGAMEVQTSGFSVFPRTASKDGKVAGWQGRAQVVLSGKDFDRITSAAAKVEGMQVSRMNFALSKEGRAKVEGDAQALAIEQFKAKAASLTKAFGFAAYTLREVSVNSNEVGSRMNAMQVPAFKSSMSSREDAAPVPVEAGKTAVEVQVSGSVQLK